ncbi:hypothetical protein J6590_086744 [Homalodisca vitripennis]|nr:hypothetical protein J6590_086744 [Homalodisca vitripennis]
MEMEQDPFDTERFIDEIEKRRALWDLESPDYKNRVLKRSAWEEVVDIFSKTESTVEEKKQLAFAGANGLAIVSVIVPALTYTSLHLTVCIHRSSNALHSGLSLSHDSVFSPEQRSGPESGSELETSSSLSMQRLVHGNTNVQGSTMKSQS